MTTTDLLVIGFTFAVMVGVWAAWFRRTRRRPPPLTQRFHTGGWVPGYHVVVDGEPPINTSTVSPFTPPADLPSNAIVRGGRHPAHPGCPGTCVVQPQSQPPSPRGKA